MKKTILYILLGILLIVPIAAIINISSLEMKQYDQDDVPLFTEKAYGEICEVFRTDIAEYYELSGKIVSDKNVFIDLQKYKSQYLRLIVEKSDEVQKGDKVGTYKGEGIYSQYNGIISEINSSNIKLRSTENLVFETYLNEELAMQFKENKERILLTEQNEKAAIVKISNIMSEKGVKALIKINSNKYVYGQELGSIKLYTGKKYEGVLVVNKDCVYKKDDGYSYIRKVDNNGSYIEECKVDTGYSTNELICVTGVEEGVKCDSGYKKVIESQQKSK